jgi:hypothetical protein
MLERKYWAFCSKCLFFREQSETVTAHCRRHRDKPSHGNSCNGMSRESTNGVWGCQAVIGFRLQELNI